MSARDGDGSPSTEQHIHHSDDRGAGTRIRRGSRTIADRNAGASLRARAGHPHADHGADALRARSLCLRDCHAAGDADAFRPAAADPAALV